MNIGVIGVNFRSADLSFREKLARNLEKLAQLHTTQPLSRVFLSTCNRFEVYFSAEDLMQAHSFLLKTLQNEFNRECSYKLYAYFCRDCFTHLCRVTAGLDSAIIAETEIQGQVKRAYQENSSKINSSELHFLFQKSLKIGKTIRSQIPIKASVPNLNSMLKQMLYQLVDHYQKPKLLFVGTSKINEALLKSLPLEHYECTVTSRTPLRAKLFAKKFQIQALSWDQLKTWHHYDGIVVATSHPKILIQVSEAAKSRPRLILDLGVPRNVCPKINEMEGHKLLNIDQLNKLVRKYRRVKTEELCKAERQIKQSVFTHWSLFEYRQRGKVFARGVI